MMYMCGRWKLAKSLENRLLLSSIESAMLGIMHAIERVSNIIGGGGGIIQTDNKTKKADTQKLQAKAA